MKFVIPFICLFFCLHTSIYAAECDKNIDYDMLNLEERLENVTEKNVVSYSKDVSDLFQKISNNLEEIQQKKKLLLDRSECVREKIKKMSNSMNSLGLKNKFILHRFQKKYPYFFECSYDFFKKYFEDYVLVNKFNSVYKEYMQYIRFSKLVDKKIDEAQRDILLQNEYSNRLLHIQNVLFKKYGDLFQTSLDGSPNPYKGIRGYDEIVPFGNMSANRNKDRYTCLTDDNLSINEYSDSWLFPISNAYKSEGTWEYSHGGLHLGVDLAAPLLQEVKAPANGIILYADAPVDSNNGYLGNMCGWPYGGGNTICMLVGVQQKLYVVSFAHLSKEIYVYPGQNVTKGTILALSGNSGNSTGPHTHVEIFALKCDLKDAIKYFVETADFSFECGFEEKATCSNYACRIRPEEIFVGR